MRRGFGCLDLSVGWPACLQRRHRIIAGVLRPRPPAICTWATRVLSGRLRKGHAAGGALVMRMEDLDPERSRQVYAEAAIEDLRWLGIRWQEGPDKGGPFAPYVQSKRRAIYLAAWRKLLRRGCLFPCRCSRKDLETALGAPMKASRRRCRAVRSLGKLEPLDDEPIYPGTCRRACRATFRSCPAPPRSELEDRRKASTGASAFPTAKRLSS